MEMVKLQSKRDGKVYSGFVYRDEKKDWQFRNYDEHYGWHDTFLTYFRPIDNECTDHSASVPANIVASAEPIM